MGRAANPNEPAVQEIVFRLLHELAFRPDAVEHLSNCEINNCSGGSRAAFAAIRPLQITN